MQVTGACCAQEKNRTERPIHAAWGVFSYLKQYMLRQVYRCMCQVHKYVCFLIHAYVLNCTAGNLHMEQSTYQAGSGTTWITVQYQLEAACIVPWLSQVTSSQSCFPSDMLTTEPPSGLKEVPVCKAAIWQLRNCCVSPVMQHSCRQKTLHFCAGAC